MSNLKFTGVWIPVEVFKSNQVSNTAKMLYGVISGLDGHEGCFASNAYLQGVLGVSERGIQCLISELIDVGLVVRTDIGGKRILKTVEHIALEGCKKLHPYNIEDNKEDKDTSRSVPEKQKNIPWSEPLPFESEQFSNAWRNWQDYRKELKKPLKPTTVKAQWRQFVLWGEKKSIESIETSIKNGWTGLFEPKNNGGKLLTSKDHNEF
jgi:hypothetical protein